MQKLIQKRRIRLNRFVKMRIDATNAVSPSAFVKQTLLIFQIGFILFYFLNSKFT